MKKVKREQGGSVNDKTKAKAKNKNLDAKVIEASDDGEFIFEHDEPTGTPASPTIKLKGRTVSPAEFTHAGGTIKWNRPVPAAAPIEIFDGETKVVEWNGNDGEV
jgi:hypothetical protein